jgi:serine phosphatase RsbU (regulator of sigma subunit)/HD-like signal output (HDOD) protein
METATLTQGPPGAIRPADLPAPPQTALAVMRACSADEVDSQGLGKLVASDPVLTAELLRVVNSPFYGLGREVGNIARAVTVLGHRPLRNLVLSISVRDALRADALPGFDIGAFWESALRCAVAARVLGQASGLDADDCFTAGLLADFGLLVLFHVRPEKAALWEELRALDPDARRQAEQEHFQTTHDQVLQMLGRAWSLPEDLTGALAGHHACEEAALEGREGVLCQVLHCADWAAAVYGAEHKAEVLERCRWLLGEQLGLEGDQADRCLGAVPAQVEQAAAALSLHVGEQPDFEQILRQANVRLAEENLSYQELTWRLERTLEERDRLAAELNNELDLAHQIQRALLPGGRQGPVTGISVPAKQLSGDFFDAVQLPDGRLYFNLADVSGKGITAALLMVKASSLFRALGRRVQEPGRLLAEINRELCETSIMGMFVTMVAGLYDPASGELRLVNAGHPPALQVSPEGVFTQLPAQAPPLGIEPEAEFPECALQLGHDSLYLFSDGLSESRLDGGDMLGINGLAGLIREHTALPPQARLQALVNRVTDATPSLRDDLTILLLEDRHGTY